MTDEHGRPCGFLDIDENDKRKKFQRRFFIVDLNCRLIKWFKENPKDKTGESSPCGCINVDYITKVDVVNKFNKLNNCFVINTPFRPYFALASNEQELKQWVEILNDAGKIVVPPEEVERLKARHQSKQSTKSTETQEAGVTYRTDIVAGVVQKKKVACEKLKLDEIPPSPTSAGSFAFDTSSDSDLSKFHFSSKNIVKQGWGVKRGHVRKNWKRRYFVLYSNGFSYYKSDKDDEAIRTIPIDEILTIKVGSEENGDHDNRENLFMVVTTDKMYYVQVDSSDEMSSWVSSFNNVIEAHRKENSQRLLDEKVGERVTTEQLDGSDETSSGGANFFRNLSRGSKTTSQSLHGSSMDSYSYNSVSWTEQAATNSSSPPKVKKDKASRSSMHKRKGSSQSSRKLQFLDQTHRLSIASVDTSRLESVPEALGSLRAYNSTMDLRKPTAPLNLDPAVDHRSSYKPSNVRKGQGILFSLNTMLNRKQERMSKNKNAHKY